MSQPNNPSSMARIEEVGGERTIDLRDGQEVPVVVDELSDYELRLMAAGSALVLRATVWEEPQRDWPRADLGPRWEFQAAEWIGGDYELQAMFDPAEGWQLARIVFNARPR